MTKHVDKRGSQMPRFFLQHAFVNLMIESHKQQTVQYRYLKEKQA